MIDDIKMQLLIDNFNGDNIMLFWKNEYELIGLFKSNSGLHKILIKKDFIHFYENKNNTEPQVSMETKNIPNLTSLIKLGKTYSNGIPKITFYIMLLYQTKTLQLLKNSVFDKKDNDDYIKKARKQIYDFKIFSDNKKFFDNVLRIEIKTPT